MNLEEKVEYFATDKAFGCLTRPALEWFIYEQKKDTTAIIIDLDGIHKLNKEIGYLDVNHAIRYCLSEMSKFKLIYAIGRVFSGDELCFILDKDASTTEIINKFKNLCSEYKIGFKFITCNLTTFNSLKSTSMWLDSMSTKLQKEYTYSKII